MKPLDIIGRQSMAQDAFGRRLYFDETLRHFATAPGGRIPFEHCREAFEFDKAWAEALVRVQLAMQGVSRDR